MTGIDKPFDKDWVRSYFAEVDRMSPPVLAAWYEPQGSFRFANSPPAVGRDAIIKALNDFYGQIDGMSHRETGLWVDAESGVFEAEVTFTRKDGKVVKIPAASILRIRDGQVHDFRMIMDATPVVGSTAG